jgi:hypothetical protein
VWGGGGEQPCGLSAQVRDIISPLLYAYHHHHYSKSKRLQNMETKANYMYQNSSSKGLVLHYCVTV